MGTDTYFPGLQNFSNNCYANSAVQLLASSNYILKLISRFNRPKSMISLCTILNALATPFEENQVFSIKPFLNSISDTRISGSYEDAQEFLQSVLTLVQIMCQKQSPPQPELSAVLSESGKTPDLLTSRQILLSHSHELPWHIVTGNQIQCFACNEKNTINLTISNFLTLTIQNQRRVSPTIYDLLAETYFPELLEGYKCNRCPANKESVVTRKFFIVSTGPSIFIHINRMAVSSKGEIYKNNRHVVFPLFIDLAGHLTYKGIETKSGSEFVLCGMIEHKGGHMSGHYICYRRFQDRWILTDDSRTTDVDLETVLSRPAYILLYERDN